MEIWDAYWDERVIIDNAVTVTDTAANEIRRIQLHPTEKFVRMQATEAKPLSWYIAQMESKGFTGDLAPRQLMRQKGVYVTDFTEAYSVTPITST